MRTDCGGKSWWSWQKAALSDTGGSGTDGQSHSRINGEARSPTIGGRLVNATTTAVLVVSRLCWCPSRRQGSEGGPRRGGSHREVSLGPAYVCRVVPAYKVARFILAPRRVLGRADSR